MHSLAELRSLAQAGKHTDPGWYRIHRRLSIHVTRVAMALGLEADHVSLLMMAATLASSALLATASPWGNAAGFVLGYTGFLLDKVDGEVARLRGRSTLRGILLDRFHHRLVEPTLLLAVAWHEYHWTGSLAVIVAGFAAVLLGSAIDENQHLAAVVLYKHLRQGGAPPGAPVARPASALSRLHRALKPLKTARTVALSLPLAAAAYALEWLVRRPVPGWCLELGALGLGAFLICQCAYYAHEGLERECSEVVVGLRRSLADAPARGDGAREEQGQPGIPQRRDPAPGSGPAEVGERWAS
jgi:phosphatidylglycerophosphate synthase